MGYHKHPNSESVIKANHEMLTSVTGRHEATIHHYTRSFRGFSAMLTPEQARKLAESDSVTSVFESREYKIHTTQSWDFLRLDSAQQYNQLPMNVKSDVIVGVIDTGIWPESRSFNDQGLGPVPTKFKGQCQTGEMFTLANCNRKIVGARFYLKGFEAGKPLESFSQTFFRSPRDGDGHGTHTASTIAGSLVSNANLFGLANGTARGGAPSVRLAIYKACWFKICNNADILSALDDAISDGIDILSLSLGPEPPQTSYFEDPVSIGSFHAFSKGILVSAAAGNAGLSRTATNVAPWIMTVAASTLNRELQSKIYLGNSKVLKSFGLNPSKLDSASGLIAGSDAAAPGIPQKNASFCQTNTLNPNLIKGKIVVCQLENEHVDRIQMRVYIRSIGGVAMILADPVAQDILFNFGIQATVIGQEEATELQTYMSTKKNPVARLSQTSTQMSIEPAPAMAAFSSKGPNTVTPDIIKPDVTAPGVNILAAWSPVALGDAGGRSLDYNIVSGTSMSCPHVSAVAAIVKASHPSWSPAAIKSAIMTTATILDDSGNYIRRHPDGSRATPFDYGSGHINPVAAIDPGLVYDFDLKDVIDFLCSNGATSAQLKNLTSETIYCNNPPKPSVNFNYPSIGVSNMKGNISVYRTVTYVGNGPTVYVSKLEQPTGVNVSVIPPTLRFTNTGEKLTFRIDFTPSKTSSGIFTFGALTWSNGIHRVRSPIALSVLSL
ncbi:unnamed protein product [Coffea canephora]|uniref:Subtilisin-like protease fibronectin type-III domain-containing protein n=1 Tax=Coffea canephora TaxID=49390 RepID=A0A068UEF3_COFCA|nr:unnamed protein product [Coffea canephora]